MLTSETALLVLRGVRDRTVRQLQLSLYEDQALALKPACVTAFENAQLQVEFSHRTGTAKWQEDQQPAYA